MRVIKRRKLEEFFEAHAQGKRPLLKWYDIVRKARWRNFAEMRTTFGDADEVRAKSGKKVVVFNIKAYRLIAAVHYEKTVKDEMGAAKIIEGKLFLFYFLTHGEYDMNSWKARL